MEYKSASPRNKLFSYFPNVAMKALYLISTASYRKTMIVKRISSKTRKNFILQKDSKDLFLEKMIGFILQGFLR